jgi:hypothetical protein
VSFCPSFPAMPSVECEPVDGTPIEVEVTSAAPYGARIDVRVEGPVTEDLCAEFAYRATCRIHTPQ